MTAQLPLSLIPYPDAILIGTAAALVEDETGGRVFLHGELALAWDVDDQVCRRLAAVQLVRVAGSTSSLVAAAFGVDPDTLRRWAKALNGAGPVALVSARSGPKGPSRLTAAVVADIRGRRAAGASLRGIAAAVGVSTDSVRRALPPAARTAATNEEVLPATSATATRTQAPTVEHAAAHSDDPAPDLPVLPAPADRAGDRAAARSPARSAGAGSTGKSGAGSSLCAAACSTVGACVSVAVALVAGSTSSLVAAVRAAGGRARRTLSVDTPTAAAIPRRLAPAARRPLMSATTAAVSREGPLGPDLADTSATGPAPFKALAQRRSVSGSTPNAAATCTAWAALIRTSCTAAKRLHTWSSTSQARASSPWRKTRPPVSSSTKAAAVPIRMASGCGIRDRGSWAVITLIMSVPWIHT